MERIKPVILIIYIKLKLLSKNTYKRNKYSCVITPVFQYKLIQSYTGIT